MSMSNWNDYGYGIRTDNLQIKFPAMILTHGIIFCICPPFHGG